MMTEPSAADRPAVPLPRRFERALVIAAHPDDAEFSFGATVARLVDEGVRVGYLIVTDGAQGGEDPAESSCGGHSPGRSADSAPNSCSRTSRCCPCSSPSAPRTPTTWRWGGPR